MRISDWSSDVCSSDLDTAAHLRDIADLAGATEGTDRGSEIRIPHASDGQRHRPGPRATQATASRRSPTRWTTLRTAPGRMSWSTPTVTAGEIGRAHV